MQSKLTDSSYLIEGKKAIITEEIETVLCEEGVKVAIKNLTSMMERTMAVIEERVACMEEIKAKINMYETILKELQNEGGAS